MLKVDARGDACPLPVVKAKKAISELKGAGEVEVLVDNDKNQKTVCVCFPKFLCRVHAA